MSLDRDNRPVELQIPKRPSSVRSSTARVTVHVSKEAQSLRPYALVLFIHIVCYSIIIVSVPSLILVLHNGDTAYASLFYGYMQGGTALLWVFSRPLFGYLSDNYGRRPFVFVFIIGLIGAMLGIVISQSLNSLIVAAIIRGLTDCSVPIIPSVIGDVIGDGDLMGRRFGQLGAAMGLGAIVGPAISFGVTYVSSDKRLPFILAVALGILNGICTLVWVKETNENRGTAKSPFRPQNSQRSLTSLGNKLNPFKVFKIFKESPFSFFLALSMMFVNISFSGLLTVIFLYTNYRYNWVERQNGIFLLYFGFLAAIVQVSILPVVLPKHRWGEKVTAYVGASSYIVGLILLGVAWQGWFLYVIAFITSLGFIMAPAVRGAMSEGVDANRQGELQGASAFLDAIAHVGGPPALTGTFSYFISPHSISPEPIPGAPFYLAAGVQTISTIFIIIAFGCCLSTRKAQPASSTDDLAPETTDGAPSHSHSNTRNASILEHIARADMQDLKARENSRSKSKSHIEQQSETRKKKKKHSRSDAHTTDGKVTLDLNVLRSPHGPKVAVHPDPNATEESPLSSRGVSPEPLPTLPRVHMEPLPSPFGTSDEPLKIHQDDNESLAAIELSSLDHKHSPQRTNHNTLTTRGSLMMGPPPTNNNIRRSLMMGPGPTPPRSSLMMGPIPTNTRGSLMGGGYHHPTSPGGMTYDSGSYSSSYGGGGNIGNGRTTNGLNDSIEDYRYEPTLLVHHEENNNDSSDDDRKARFQRSDSVDQTLMVPIANDRYIAVRTSSMDEREQSKLKIHLSEDESNGESHYRVNRG